MKYNIIYTNQQTGGGKEDIAEFIPYSDHYKMSEEYKIKNPKYCPDLFPFLCNKNSTAQGKCRKQKNDCTKKIIKGEKDINYLLYKN